ncbi:hypothetical protein SDC9_92585 [bioreactor metagenome]|uniref:Uncharacterized protein n=1 Tax=bioreactor metagenome TaxID=1076179 RepID=A0A645A4X2_9ZZZZ
MDDGVGRVQNVLGRAVILLQPDGTGVCVLLFKVQDVFDVRAPKAVDRLVVVAHHAEIFAPARQQRGQKILQMVGVLILVHQYVAELVLIILPHFRVPL